MCTGVRVDDVDGSEWTAGESVDRLEPYALGVDVLGERATMVHFSSAFCAPCRQTRQTLAQVSQGVEGVAHVEIDAESNLDLVRDVGVRRTPTVLLLDSDGRIVTRALGPLRTADVRAVLAAVIAS